MAAVRSPVGVTVSVWKALFLREVVHRLFNRRAAWLWLLLEPIVHVAFLMFLFTAVRLRTIGGIDTGLWLMVGLSAFFMFRRTGMQAMNAVRSNLALFVYRQVRPVDTVVSRAGVEGFLMILVTAILFLGAGLVGIDVAPDDPLAVLAAFFGLWMLGVGFGLITSVAQGLIPELGNMISLLMTPLYLVSGVIFPIGAAPQPYRDWLMYNPVAHGLEAARLGFAPYYHAVPELSVAYLYAFALSMIFIGFVLHVRFTARLTMQ